MTHNDQQRHAHQPAYDEELLRLTAEYAGAARAGKSPRLADYVRRAPHLARELAEFALSFAAITVELPAPDARPVGPPSEAAQRAFARIRETRAAYATSAAASETPASAPIMSLFRRGLAVGCTPPQLIAGLDLSPDLVSKLEARVIAVSSIPRTLVERLAALLQTSADAVQAYLGGAQAQGAQLLLAERPLEYRQESFLEALRTSSLTDEQKRIWTETAQHDGITQ
ncbi:MAG: hypothetical protein ACHQ4H_12255 [Ktedonobacterales bacterium]